MSRASELDHIVKQYIVERIDNSGYSDTQLGTRGEKVRFLYDTFKSEYGHNIARMGEQKAFASWLAGLPSSCNIDFENSDILDLAVKWGSLADDATEKQEQKILDNWFHLIAGKALQLVKKYKTA